MPADVSLSTDGSGSGKGSLCVLWTAKIRISKVFPILRRIEKSLFHKTTKRSRILEVGVESIVKYKSVSEILGVGRERLIADYESKLSEVQYREYSSRSSVSFTEWMNLPYSRNESKCRGSDFMPADLGILGLSSFLLDRNHNPASLQSDGRERKKLNLLEEPAPFWSD